MRREWQVRTETVCGDEQVQSFETEEAARAHYTTVCEKRNHEEEEEAEYLHDIEHIELIEVLEQDRF